MNKEYKVIDKLVGMFLSIHLLKRTTNGYILVTPNYIKLTVECDRDTDVQEIINRLTENERIALFNVAIIKSTKGLLKYNMVVKALLYDDVLKTAYDLIDNDKKKLRIVNVFKIKEDTMPNWCYNRMLVNKKRYGKV